MSNFYIEPPQEITPFPACPMEALELLAHEAATVEAQGRYLRVIADPNEVIQSDEISRLDERWMKLNGVVRTIVGEDEDLQDFFQNTYTPSLLEAFKKVRVAHAESVST